MEQKGTFSITVEAGYQLKFRQTVDELLRPINTNPDYSNVRNYITNIDSDTGIMSVKTTLTTQESVDVDESECYQKPPLYDENDGQWYPGVYNDEPKFEYDANGIMTDLKSVIKKMDPIGQVFIKFGSVRTDDYERIWMTNSLVACSRKQKEESATNRLFLLFSIRLPYSPKFSNIRKPQTEIPLFC